MWQIFIPIFILLVARLFNNKQLSAAGWVSFGAYWVYRLPYYALEARSVIETILILVGVPACIYVAYLVYNENPTSKQLTDVVVTAGAILTLSEVPIINEWLIEVVTIHSSLALSFFAENTIAVGKNGYQSQLIVTGSPYTTYVTTACTGVGAISVFAGLLVATDGPVVERLKAGMISIGTIYVLNIGRNVYISLSYANQWLESPTIAKLVGYGDTPELVPFFISHTVVSQLLAVLVILALLGLCARMVPSLRQLLIDVIELAEESIHVVKSKI